MSTGALLQGSHERQVRERTEFVAIAMRTFDQHLHAHRRGGEGRARALARRDFERASAHQLASARGADGRLCDAVIEDYATSYALLTTDPPRRAFLESAYAVLVDLASTRLRHPPSTIGDRAYDLAQTAIERRATRGVADFLDARGALRVGAVRSYVSVVIDRKLKQAWHEHATAPRITELHPATSELAEELRESHDRDGREVLLARARDELDRMRLASVALEERRMRAIEHALDARGVTALARSVVLARTAREWTLEVTENGVVRGARPSASWREIADALSISTANAAAKAFSRTLARLPGRLRGWIVEPWSFEASASPSARPSAAGRPPRPPRPPRRPECGAAFAPDDRHRVPRSRRRGGPCASHRSGGRAPRARRAPVARTDP